ncbi:MAG: EFR1 family ferrodoxin [Spirochaetaceae bacterium]|jgi:NAD-dependent dihydropyrimidine dehydrogenase PreA subunit|nr:EFR1 family ferrodoxin [Spirochaetaceae bacterium]
MKIFYLTSTGNSLFVARQLGTELYSIPQVLKEGIKKIEADEIGIVYPCYGVGTPQQVLKFLDQVKLKSSYIFAVMTYGKMAGASASHLEREMKKRGIHLSYFRQILMVDNYLPLFDMQREIASIPEKKIDQQLSLIEREIHRQKHRIHRNTLPQSLFTWLYQIHHNHLLKRAHKKIHIQGECKNCKICVKTCSMDNITLESKGPMFGKNCQFCLACAHHCPEQIIRIKGEKGSSRFRHEEVSLKDIIAANQ